MLLVIPCISSMSQSNGNKADALLHMGGGYEKHFLLFSFCTGSINVKPGISESTNVIKLT